MHHAPHLAECRVELVAAGVVDAVLEIGVRQVGNSGSQPALEHLARHVYTPRVVPCRGGHDLYISERGDTVERLGLPCSHDDDVFVIAVHNGADESGFGKYPLVVVLLEVVLVLLRPHPVEM